MTVVQSAHEGLTVAQAAERLGVSNQTIRDWVKKGELPATRFGASGRIIRIAESDLETVRGPA